MFSCACSNFYGLGMVEVFGHWFMLIYSIFHCSVLICFKVTIKITSWTKHTCQSQWITPSLVSIAFSFILLSPLLYCTYMRCARATAPSPWTCYFEDKDIVQFISHLSSTLHFALDGGMFSGMLIECISGHRNALYSFRQEVGGNFSLCESDGQIRGVM